MHNMHNNNIAMNKPPFMTNNDEVSRDKSKSDQELNVSQQQPLPLPLLPKSNQLQETKETKVEVLVEEEESNHYSSSYGSSSSSSSRSSAAGVGFGGCSTSTAAVVAIETDHNALHNTEERKIDLSNITNYNNNNNDNNTNCGTNNTLATKVKDNSKSCKKQHNAPTTLNVIPITTKSIKTKDWQVDFSKFPIVETDKATKLKKRISKFYTKQNELVEGFANLYTNTITKDFLVDGEDGYMEMNDGENIKEDSPIVENQQSAKDDRYAHLCIQASFWVNVLLLFLKISASLLSLSLSVITSTVDSVLDIVSGLILVYTNHLKRKKGDIHMYPVGKDRLEPLSFIIFATCMSTASLQIIKEGVVTIIGGLVTGSPYLPENTENLISWISKPETLNGEMEWMFGIKVTASFKLFAYVYSLAVLLIAVILKSILYFMCSRAKSASCEAYAFDHRNDVLSNSFLVASLFVSMWAWWVDPFSAIVLSCYIIYGWIGESMEHVTKLVGLSAESDLIQKLTFIAYNHCEKIVKVDLVTAWHSGLNIIAEIHVVLPPDMPLKEAHNIGEKLQTKIESVPEVERCFVHLDFNDTHKNERSLYPIKEV